MQAKKGSTIMSRRAGKMGRQSAGFQGLAAPGFAMGGSDNRSFDDPVTPMGDNEREDDRCRCHPDSPSGAHVWRKAPDEPHDRHVPQIEGVGFGAPALQPCRQAKAPRSIDADAAAERQAGGRAERESTA